MDDHAVRLRQKICPACSTRNAGTAFFCVQCGADISTVRVTENNTAPGLPPMPRPGEVLPPLPRSGESLPPMPAAGEILPPMPAPAATLPPMPRTGAGTPPAPARASTFTPSERVCPQCGQSNAAYLLLCRSCGADLSTARMAEAARPAAGAADRPPPPPMPAPGNRPGVAVGAETLAPSWESSLAEPAPAAPVIPTRNVGSHLTGFAQEAPRAVGVSDPQLVLSVGQRTFSCRDGDIFGREGTLASDIFSAIRTVSRRHVQVLFRGGHWFILSPAEVPNITQLDGREVPRGVPQPLRGEHRLRMSTQCEVILRVAAPTGKEGA